MNIPVPFACPACTTIALVPSFLSFCIGGVLISYCLLKPHVKKISTIWGWPSLNTASNISLLLLSFWPGLFCWIGSQNHSALRVMLCTTGLVSCTIYLWLRGCWLLQQCHIASLFRQVLFLGILGPGILIVGTIVGQGIVGSVLFAMYSPSAVKDFFMPYAAMSTISFLLLYYSLEYVFSDSKEKSDKQSTS